MSLLEKKTKAEVYLERLEKWRAERQKTTSAKKGPTVKTEKMEVPKKIPVKSVPPRQSLRPQQNATRPSQQPTKKSNPPSQPNATRQSQLAVKRSNPPPQHKVLKPVYNEGQEKMMEKLEKWRQQKDHTRSTQKITKQLTSTSKPTQGQAKTGNFINVKSRLFDYQSKPRPTISKPATDKENRVASATARTSKMFRPAAQKKDTSLKRRHSESLRDPPKKKPVGILKRKSCIGSFEMTTTDGLSSNKKRKGDDSSKTKGEQSNKDVRRLSAEEGVGVTTGEDEVFIREGEGSHHCGAGRNVRFTTPDHSDNTQGRELRKTPKPTNNKSQELSDWLKAKGRTPSKFRHLLCFHDHDGQQTANDPCTKMSLTVDELSEQRAVIEAEQQEAEARAKLEVMLEECMTLFEAGCPTEAIIPWLDSIYSKIPVAKSCARFYICKAAVVKMTHDLDAVLKVFEDATINDAQPKEEIAKCLTETIKYVTEQQIKKVKRRSASQRRSLVQEENMFESSSVVYVVSKATPISEGKLRRRPDTPATNCKVITPVRRSTRRSLQNLPESLKDKKETFASLNEVNEQDRDKFLFQPNLALDKVLAEAGEEKEGGENEN